MKIRALIDLLRSGKYQWGQRRLKSSWDQKYCCLGAYAKETGILDENGRVGGNGTSLDMEYRPEWMTFEIMSSLIALNDTSETGYAPVIAYLEQLDASASK